MIGDAHSLELAGNQRLLVEETAGTSTLTLHASDGGVALTIVITAAGPVLHFQGASLALHTDGALAIDAASVTIRGRDHITLVSEGDATVTARGTLTTEGSSQRITAVQGDVRVVANDDVALDGERIRMNC